jgi:hypothetical protein
MSSFLFKDSFSGYSLSFSLLYNSQAPNAIVNISDPSGNYCIPFGSQFILESFANSYEANNINKKTLNTYSTLNSQKLADLFGVAYSPGSFKFDYEYTNGAPTKAQVTLNYAYSIDPTTQSKNLNPITFTFTGGSNALTLAMSDTQEIAVPYWTDQQLQSGASGCPSVVKIKVQLEADRATQQVFSGLIAYILLGIQNAYKNNVSVFPNDNLTIAQLIQPFIQRNPGYDDSANSFPIFALKVVLSGDLPPELKDIRRPFFISNTLAGDGGSFRILSSVNDKSFESISTLISKQTQDVNTIGFLVFSNLTINITNNNGFTLNNKSGQVNLNMGTFPTVNGAQQLVDFTNTIKNGDVVYLQSTQPNQKNIYLSFQKNSNVKVPTLQPNPSNTCLWQIVKLSKDGYTIIPETGNEKTDSISYGDIVGFYAYNCSGTPNTLCGWMSSNPGTCNCTPYMSGGHGCCETWYFFGGKTGYVYDKESPVIQCNITQPCPLCSKNNYFLSETSFFQDPPTLQSPPGNESDAWKISKVYSQKPLPN